MHAAFSKSCSFLGLPSDFRPPLLPLPFRNTSFNPFTFDRRFIMNWTTILCQIAIAAVTALANEAVKTIRENDKTDN